MTNTPALTLAIDVQGPAPEHVQARMHSVNQPGEFLTLAIRSDEARVSLYFGTPTEAVEFAQAIIAAVKAEAAEHDIVVSAR